MNKLLQPKSYLHATAPVPRINIQDTHSPQNISKPSDIPSHSRPANPGNPGNGSFHHLPNEYFTPQGYSAVTPLKNSYNKNDITFKSDAHSRSENPILIQNDLKISSNVSQLSVQVTQAKQPTPQNRANKENISTPLAKGTINKHQKRISNGMKTEPNENHTEVNERRTTISHHNEGQVYYINDRKVLGARNKSFSKSPSKDIVRNHRDFSSFAENKENFPFSSPRAYSPNTRIATSPGGNEKLKRRLTTDKSPNRLHTNKGSFVSQRGSSYKEACLKADSNIFCTRPTYGIDTAAVYVAGKSKKFPLFGAGAGAKMMTGKKTAPVNKAQIEKRKADLNEWTSQLDEAVSGVKVIKEEIIEREKNMKDSAIEIKNIVTKFTENLVKTIQSYSNDFLVELESIINTEVSQSREGLGTLIVCEDKVSQLKTHIKENYNGILHNVEGQHTELKMRCAEDLKDLQNIAQELQDVIEEPLTITVEEGVSNFKIELKAIVEQVISNPKFKYNEVDDESGEIDGLKNLALEKKKSDGKSEIMMKGGSSTKKRNQTMLLSLKDKDTFENGLRSSSKKLNLKVSHSTSLDVNDTPNFSRYSLLNSRTKATDSSAKRNGGGAQSRNSEPVYFRGGDDLVIQESKNLLKDFTKTVEEVNNKPSETENLDNAPMLRNFARLLSQVNENQKKRINEYYSKQKIAEESEHDQSRSYIQLREEEEELKAKVTLFQQTTTI